MRVRAVSLLWQLWQQAAARWPTLPHGLQLAEALARAANRSALLDPSGKVRLAVVRLLLGLAPQLGGSDLREKEIATTQHMTAVARHRHLTAAPLGCGSLPAHRHAARAASFHA